MARYIERVPTVEARQWSGNESEANELILWVLDTQASQGARWVAERVQEFPKWEVITAEHIALTYQGDVLGRVNPGDYLVLSHGQFVSWPAARFVERYRVSDAG